MNQEPGLRPSTDHSTTRVWLFACFVLGCVARLLWWGDVEYKYDEQLMFEMAHHAVNTGTLPWVGMKSGAGIVNPGFSVWPFALFANFSTTPLGMTLWVIGLNVLTMALWLTWWTKKKPGPEKELWAWGMCLFFVNPLAVVYARKIWAQDLLPFFVFFFLWAFEGREKKWGSFFVGFLGPILGQLHLSGFFAAGALSLSSFVLDWKRQRRLVQWKLWFLGSVIGSIPLLFWLETGLETLGAGSRSFAEIFSFKFFTQSFANATGLNLITLFRGNLDLYKEFLLGPKIGFSSALVAVGHAVMLALGLHGLYRWLRNKVAFAVPEFSSTLFFCYMLVGGLALQLSRSTVHAHYTIVFFPVLFVFLARCHMDRPKLLRAMVVVQCLLTFLFLSFVHKHHGIPGGNYGTAYSAQPDYRTEPK